MAEDDVTPEFRDRLRRLHNHLTEIASSERDLKIFDLQDELTFGKYKGSTLEDVLARNPKYIAWCADNISWFRLSQRATEVLQSKMQATSRILYTNDVDLDTMNDQELEEYYDDWHGGFTDDSWLG